MKLGCIGYGNMAGAIVGGLLAKKLLPPEEIIVYDALPEKLDLATQKGLKTANNITELVNNADMILLSVKPKDFSDVLRIAKNEDPSSKAFISIAAGISIEKINTFLGSTVPVVRTMPNTPLLLGMGTTAICRNAFVADADYAFAKQIFQAAGTVYELPEAQFNDVINLNGSSPAYIYLFAKTIAEFAQNNGGIPYDTGLAMVCDTLKGAAQMLQESGLSAEQLIQAVSSPGGTTVAALDTFHRTGFTESLEAGMKACVNRAAELGKGD